MKLLPLLTLLVIAVAIAPPAAAERNDPTTYTAVGESLPEIDLTTTDGVRITNETLKGSVVVLNFFATWCGPCKRELPRIEKEVWEAFKDEDFKLVVVGREHTAAELNAFRHETGYTFLLAPDPNRETYGKFAKESIPRNYVIDRDGTILYQSIGYGPQEFDAMVGVIEEALRSDTAEISGADPSREADPTPDTSKLQSVTVSGETRIRVQYREN